MFRSERPALHALSIALMYFAFGVTWVVGTDWLVMIFISPDPELLRFGASIKGTVFVTLSAALIFVLVWRLLGHLERKEAVRRAAEERFRLIAENITEVFWMTDVGISKMLYISPGYERIWKRSCDGLYSEPRSFLDPIHPDDRDRVVENIKAQDIGQSYDNEYRIFQPDGSLRWIWDRGFPVRDQSGCVTGYVGVAQDITERKRHEQELVTARYAAEVANRAKSRFIATMSHELRTPLNAIMGFIELAHSETFGPIGDPKYLEHAEDAQLSAQHLLSLINDILDISKIEAGKMQLNLSTVSAEQAIHRSIRLVKRDIKDRELTVNVDLPAGMRNVCADERAIHQILVNVLSNAVKFTPVGGVITICGVEKDGGIAITVTDTGVGIASDKICRAVEPFEQLDDRLCRRHEGTGLGLTIVQKLVDLHGGRLTHAYRVDADTH